MRWRSVMAGKTAQSRSPRDAGEGQAQRCAPAGATNFGAAGACARNAGRGPRSRGIRQGKILGSRGRRAGDGHRYSAMQPGAAAQTGEGRERRRCHPQPHGTSDLARRLRSSLSPVPAQDGRALYAPIWTPRSEIDSRPRTATQRDRFARRPWLGTSALRPRINAAPCRRSATIQALAMTRTARASGPARSPPPIRPAVFHEAAN